MTLKNRYRAQTRKLHSVPENEDEKMKEIFAITEPINYGKRTVNDGNSLFNFSELYDLYIDHLQFLC